MSEIPPTSSTPAAAHPVSPDQQASRGRYWRANLRLMSVLLIIWAAVSLGCGILFADTLNQFSLGGIPLGFWFAQQGSIIVFVFLILIYAIMMNRLDKKHWNEMQQLQASSSSADKTNEQAGGEA